MKPTRLQLGTSRLEYLGPDQLRVFLDQSWIHLGEAGSEQKTAGKSWRAFWRPLTQGSFTDLVLGAWRRLSGKSRAGRLDIQALEQQTTFREFFYRAGDRLPFESDSFHFVFSEHFLEHLFLDEALALLRECHRVLMPGGVLRTSVPDADLRTYEAPEPVGFPDPKMPYTEPAKHKTRWSVYSLTAALTAAGFEVVPLRYCDKMGRYVGSDPAEQRHRYAACPEPELIFDLSYLRRIHSLIVDGIKSPRQDQKEGKANGA